MINILGPSRDYLSGVYTNIFGWRTKKKIIVFESDDWGSIRMPSLHVYKKLKGNGIQVEKSPYLKYDTIENSDDINELGQLLLRFHDNKGNHPNFTLNYVMGNPDFHKIAQSNYENYFYQTFIDTFYEYYKNHSLLDSLMFYRKLDVFDFQFHSREHVNVGMWLKLLREGDSLFRMAFDYGLYGLSNDIMSKYKRSIQATYDYPSPSEIEFLSESIADGVKIFNSVFGYAPRSFIPNNFIWPTNSTLNECLSTNGIRYIQGMKYQLLPLTNEKKRAKIRRYSGRIDSFSFLHLIRNCEFEPSLYLDINCVEKCIQQIQIAFMHRKPAIISSHRLNYIGGLVESNRRKNLNLLNELLQKILILWPNVEFYSSVNLAEAMEESRESKSEGVRRV